MFVQMEAVSEVQETVVHLETNVTMVFVMKLRTDVKEIQFQMVLRVTMDSGVQ
jgi:hypothetical protein